jgi:two-component system, LuxR family, sensor kinase FixL
MKDILKNRNRTGKIALRISAIYAMVGALWILSSDTLLSLFISEPAVLTHLQTFKGWAFIAVTAFLLYVLVSRYVSAMEHSEQALRESEKKFRILADTAASAIFLYRDTFITVNRAFEELTGYPEGELRSMSFFGLLHPDSREKIAAHCDALLRGNGSPMRTELKLITRKGDERWIDFTCSIIDFEGKTCGMGTAYDITDRKQAEQTLKESEERLRLLIERVRDYEIFMLDPEGRIIIWNVGAEKNKGYSVEEIIGRHHSIFFTPEDIEAGVPEQELKVAAAEGGFEDEGWRVRKDGSLFWADVVTTALRDSDGALKGFSKVIRDITDRKKAEDALRESEERYRIIAETASDVIITIDQESIIQFVSAASEKVFGYSTAELLGQNITMLMPERLRQAHISALKAYVETGKKKMKWESIELPGLHKDGKEVPLEISYGEFMKEGRHFFAGIVRDNTERREAIRDKEYREMLERFNQELENLVAERTMNLLAMTLADRVRNPSSTIGATANRVLRKEECSEKAKGDFRLIINESEKLDKTVKDFQTLLKSRQKLFHYEDICGIVRDVLPVIVKEAARKQILLSVNLPDMPLKINTERNLLKMAVYTVMKNAVELTPDKGKVSVLVAGDQDRIRVTVSDNGYGIPKEDIDTIFDPFTGTYGYRFVMGLPLIKQIVSEHMGEISIESEIGKGTTVTMVFPVRWSGVNQAPDSSA